MLAQIHQITSADSVKIVIWSLVLIGILVMAFALVAKVKRRVHDEVDKNPTATAGFTLSDLRQMHRNGIITEDEFEKAKARIVQSAKRKAGVASEASPGDNADSTLADEKSLEFLDEPPPGGTDAPPT